MGREPSDDQRGMETELGAHCPVLRVPEEIRKVIYTTNAVESLNMSLRKIIKTRGSFPNEEAAVRLLWLALRNHSKKWSTIQGEGVKQFV